MAPLTKDVIRSLAGFKSRGSHVVSLYLDVDGRRHIRAKDYEVHLDGLLRQAGASRTDADGDRRAGGAAVARAKGSRPGLSDDLRRIASHVHKGLDRSHTRGLAIFACAEASLWEVFELPVPVRDQIVVNDAPQLRQLERVLEENERFAVLLADRQRARVLVFELGELIDKSELLDLLPRHEDDQGDWDRDHVHDHQAQAARHHLRRAAQVAFEVFKAQGFEHLVLGATDAVVHELERELHPYLRERIAARLPIPVGAKDKDIRHAVLGVQEQVDRARETERVERLRDGVATGGGVAGLAAVLVALVARRVDTLLVSDGYQAPGWRCATCGYLAAKGRGCPACGSRMTRADDVVEEAVEEALRQSCTVCTCTGRADLDVLGRIGAILRF